jgi:exopolysaccharide biosynthesis polyprenyl glycosylphosphotransferase
MMLDHDSGMLYHPKPVFRRFQLRISERRLLLMLGDVVAVAAAVLVAIGLWALAAPEPFDLTFVLARIHWLVILIVIWLVLAGSNDLYNLHVASSRGSTVRRLLSINIQLLLLYGVIFFFSAPLSLPRLFIIYYALVSFATITLFRMLNPALVGWLGEKRRVLIVGTDWAAVTMIGAIGRFAHDIYDIRGVIAEEDDILRELCDVPVLGTGRNLEQIITTENISELIVTSTHQLSGPTFQGVMTAYQRGVSIVPMPLLYERITGQVPVEHVINNWAVVLPFDQENALNLYPSFKRALDIVLALIGSVVFLLLLPILALVIRADSPGGIFYSQQRLGLNGRRFNIYKFRSMRTDAESTTGAVFSHRGDPRVTRIGRFMRKTRLDELPQVINVLKGDMSIVGPRPERPEHIARLTEKIPFYQTRLVIRPGLTGWAQVRYAYGSTDEDAMSKLQYDLYYIRHQSFMLDVDIMLRTVGKVLKMSGV